MSRTLAALPAPYRPHYSIEPRSAGLLISLAVATGVLLGGALSVVSQWAYLLLLFPLAIGLTLGFGGRGVVKALKIRSRAVVIAASVCAGLSWLISMQFGSYLHHVGQIKAMHANPMSMPVVELARLRGMELTNEIEAIAQEEERTSIAEVVAAIQAADSFHAYVIWNLDQGLTISRSGQSESIVDFGPLGAYALYLLELLIVITASAKLLLQTVRRPFCSESDRWKDEYDLLFRCEPTATKEALNNGDLRALGAMLTTAHGNSEANTHGLKIFLSELEDGRSTVDIQFYELKTEKNGKAERIELAFLSFPPSSRAEIEALVLRRLSELASERVAAI